MSKRRREDVSQLVVQPAAVCNAVLDVVQQWRDKCNALYDVESKMLVGKDSIVLKAGFFDELQCSQVLSLNDVPLPGNYAVQSASCDLNKQLVSFIITRGASAKRACLDAPAASRGATDSEMLRLRTVFDVKEADAADVHAALHATTRCFDSPGDWHLARCAPRPAHYVLHVAVSCGVVPDGVMRLAADYKGLVDFDNKQLVLVVEKKQSEIT
jgi:hypothetical protein